MRGNIKYQIKANRKYLENAGASNGYTVNQPINVQKAKCDLTTRSDFNPLSVSSVLLNSFLYTSRMFCDSVTTVLLWVFYSLILKEQNI